MGPLLYHCFPGFLSGSRLGRNSPATLELSNAVGMLVLQSLLENGFLLTPEVFSLSDQRITYHAPDCCINPRFHRTSALPRSSAEDPAPIRHFSMIQVRGCFTLATRRELAFPHGAPAYQTTSNAAQSQEDLQTHYDLFGGFAVGLDPMEARCLGAIPTIYYYGIPGPTLVYEPLRNSSSLSLELVSRLLEARTLLVILAHIEALADDGNAYIPDLAQLEEMGQTLAGLPSLVERATKGLTRGAAKEIGSLFDTDRVPIWNIVQHIEMLLSLFQVADSRCRYRALVYYQQREWRLIQHNKCGLICEPLIADVFHSRLPAVRRAARTLSEIDEMLEVPFFLEMLTQPRATDCPWLLSGCDGRAFRDFIKEIVVPDELYDLVQRRLSNVPFLDAAPKLVPRGQRTENDSC